MNVRRDPDRLIASYFEQDMPELPDRVFDAVRRDIHGTRQRLVLWPWQQPEARVLARAFPIAAALVVAFGLLVMNVSGPGSGSPRGVAFRSPLYGYAIVVPQRWGTTPAVVRWDGRAQPSLDDTVDVFSGPHLIVLAYAGPFTGDLAAFTQDRLAANVRDHSDTCPSNALQATTSISIGGQPGVLLTLDCGAQIDQAMTVHDGRAYAFTIRDAGFLPTLDRTDLATVRSMLESVTFPTPPSTP
jgi:hypothetical protein